MKPIRITAAILALSIVSSAMPAFEVSAADAVTTTTAKAAVTTTTTAAQTTTTQTTTSESATTTTTTAAVSSTDSDTKLYALDHKSWCEFNEKTGELILHGELDTTALLFFTRGSEIKSITAADDAVFPEICVGFFGYAKCKGCTKIDLSKADTSKVTNMSTMFYGCCSLKEVVLGNIDTSKVKTMSYMFSRCYSIEKIDISGLDTSSVEEMGAMFKECYALESVDFGNINTSNVNDISGIFSECYSLTEADLSAFSLSNIKKNYGIFESCNRLKKLKLGEKTGSITDEMLLPNSGWYNVNDPSDPSVKASRFTYYCIIENTGENTYACEPSPEKLLCYSYDSEEKMLVIRGIADKKQIQDFPYKEEVKKINVPAYLPDDCSGFFSGFTSCETIDIAYAKGYPVDMSSMFKGCESLKSIAHTSYSYPELDTARTENMSSMFEGCKALTTLDIPAFDTSKVTKADSMFAGCDQLSTIVLGENFNIIDEAMKLRNGGWANKRTPDKCVSGNDQFAVISNSGKNTYIFTGNAEPVSMGDCNLDGAVNAADLVTLSNFLLGKKTAAVITTESSDLNGDGTVDIFDVVALRKLLIQKN